MDSDHFVNSATLEVAGLEFACKRTACRHVPARKKLDDAHAVTCQWHDDVDGYFRSIGIDIIRSDINDGVGDADGKQYSLAFSSCCLSRGARQHRFSGRDVGGVRHGISNHIDPGEFPA